MAENFMVNEACNKLTGSQLRETKLKVKVLYKKK